MDMIRSDDWKTEKHVPVIEVLDKDKTKVEVSVGKEIPHPNELEHHIRWIALYYVPEGAQILYPVGRAEFNAHGEMKTFTEPKATFEFKAPKDGKLVALSLCNIHGLWKHEAELK